jgi:gamma-glutamyltranspeptidase/glutathione hydrolase
VFICVHLWFPRLFAASLLAACTLSRADVVPSQPEPSSGWTAKKVAYAKREMVAAAHPLAVDAGLAMLRRGGNAIDAMVATQLVLGLVEPGSSGLGGGAYFLHYDARAKEIHAIDARETAPALATPDLFLRPDGTPMAFPDARIGGRAVGVPGVPRLLEVAHARYGKLAWKTLFEPAIALAENGFRITPRLVRVASGEKGLADEPGMRGYLFDADGRIKPAGTMVRNPAYAATLRQMAGKGADAFYTGEIADDMVAAVRTHANPGRLSLDDLASYRVRDVEPVCAEYRVWRLCGVPPSSSGGIGVLQVLGELGRFDLASVRPGSVGAVHLISEAERLAFADRARYVADDRFVEVPLKGLLDPGYLAERSRSIRLERSMGVARAGTPEGVHAAFADDTVEEVAGTTHLSIVDREGNAVALTSSIESGYGSHRMVRGFFLNNQLTDFSFVPVEGGAPVANAVAPGKRPRSSMAPFFAFDRGGALEIVVGSPGGSHIIGFVVKVLVAALDWKMDMQSAIDLPNFGSRNGPTEVEAGTELERLRASLSAMAHDVRMMEMTSGLHAIRRARGGWEGGADPRREGVARGN